MNEPKFKVGQHYRTARGNVIKISEMNEAYARYELISGKDVGRDRFHINSLYAEELTLVCEKIVITTDGKTTTAKMYDGKKLVNSAKAICSPDDEFDFERGAGIAISRLLGWDFVPVEEEPYYNGKVVCVSSGCYDTAFTVGKIYEITEGELKAESCAYLTEIKKVSDINEHFKREGVKFLEIVE
jgi:hypothetical protein